MPKRRTFLALLLAASLGVATVLSPSPANYYPHAIGDFDGTNDYLSLASDLTGNADSKLWLFSAWLRFDGGDATHQVFAGSTGSGIIIYKHNSNKIRMYAEEPGNGLILDQYSTTTYTAGATWYHVLCSGDLGNNKAYIYVNDVSVGDTPATLVDDEIDYTRPAWAVGATTVPSIPMNGAIAELYLAREYLDISSEANRRKFIDTNGYPVDLGLTGYKPTGTAPIMYFRSRANNAGLNSGTGGDFTINGAPLFTEGPVPYFPLTTQIPDRGRGRSRGMRIH